MKRISILLFILVYCAICNAQFSNKYSTFKKFDGLFSFFYDDSTDKIYLEVTDLEKEFLYVSSLSSGVGSNDIGLDRGQLGKTRVVYFKKAGNKLLLIQPNLKYRALTNNALEKQSVEQAFAKSILGGFKIEEEANGKYLIDITSLFMQDTHGVANKLKNTAQGNYSLDASKSAFNLERTKAFPKNIEFDVFLTFKGTAKGRYISSVAPTSGLVTVAQHHSFVELPDNKFKKRSYHPRSGSFMFSYYDYATPIEQDIHKRFITRHRLQKKNPNAAISEAVEPIVYYLDNGTPEPVRTALLEGGRWWNQAFEAIGYKNAFQLKILPADADPMDVRYNVIQWVHRSTRGWSYGASVTDPRTGEIIKGHVSLGSLRIRQDFLIAQALTNKPFAKSDDNNNKMLELALARIRQLSAHEIGHTLGFAHNFAASTNNRASVMDYPHPQFKLKGKNIDFSGAYAEGIGEWDKYTVAYSYSDFKEDKNEDEELKKIIQKAQKEGYRFISDRDARASGGAHAYAHLWDNGGNATEELNKVLKIRAVGISNFSIDNIKEGQPNSVLEDVFAPLYFFHRYQTEAVTKLIGGLDYNYTVKGDQQLTVKAVSKKEQQEALQSLLQTVNAEQIAIPKNKLSLFPPRALGYGSTRESFNGKTGISFDALSAAETAADMTLSFLLHPQRASRLVQQKSLDSKQIGLHDVLDQLINNTFKKSYKDTYLDEAQQNINFRVLYYIKNLAASKSVHPKVNAIANFKLQELKDRFLDRNKPYALEVVNRIEHFQKHPELFKPIVSPKIPDGSPIGMECMTN
ncbi:zinc-dependent metalloprotease [Cellulophaga omnivescoria]|uniref:zinc-dependent metalloprotease n=1 Tax=Cellulophaga omnivescoria TaxID=1888890 RepID=UPI0022F137EA|nr:zinc-dependent metalloprotease [Cellulophaga omnivescoria]WBU88891.1 zinc-dependent metalloprotease [Cellulophaga omnivescoria]